MGGREQHNIPPAVTESARWRACVSNILSFLAASRQGDTDADWEGGGFKQGATAFDIAAAVRGGPSQPWPIAGPVGSRSMAQYPSTHLLEEQARSLPPLSMSCRW